MKCSCGHEFAPTPLTYVGTQLYPFAVHVLHNCPRVKDDGEVCASTRALVLWEDFDEQEPVAAE